MASLVKVFAIFLAALPTGAVAVRPLNGRCSGRPGAAFVCSTAATGCRRLQTAARIERPVTVLFAKKSNKEENEEDDKREGMAEAFASLDAISSLDLDDDKSTEDLTKGVTAADTGGSNFDGPPEEEMKLYKEMYDELEAKGEEGMYSTILDEMGGKPIGGSAEASSASKDAGKSILDDADGIGTASIEEDDSILTYKGTEATEGEVSEIGEPNMEEFMDKALREALAEARSQTPGEIAATAPSDRILDDKEMMKEINDIFDEANKKLVDSIKQIQEEQTALAKESAQERQDAVKESEQRLVEAEEGVARLMDNVVKETAEVEKALSDLKEAQDKMNADPLTKMANLKGGGIAKQGAFVGMVLFSIRTLAEVALMAGPNGGTHVTAAAIQGAIAVACAAYLAFA